MLFLQGARDTFAEPELLNPLLKRLGALATLCLLRAADHSFHVPARSSVNDAEINAETRKYTRMALFELLNETGAACAPGWP